MAIDFRDHPMFRARGFNAPTRFEADIYDCEAIKEDGRWKLSKVHAFNTWGAGYDDGWMEKASGFVPGPSSDFPPDGPPTFEFSMWPTVYAIPFHYQD